MYKAVIFDCDGVLVDSEKILAHLAAKELNKLYGYPAQAEDFYPYIGTGEDTYLGSVVRKYGGVYDEEFLKEKIYNRYIEEAVNYDLAMPQAKEVLVELFNRGLLLAVASSADQIKVDANLASLKLDFNPFKAIITGSDVTKKKPDPEIYLLAAKKLGISPKHCLVIEDAKSGILAAKAAKMDALAFTSSLEAQDFYELSPEYIASSLGAILELI